METLEGLFKWSHEVTIIDSLGEPLKKSDGTDWKVYQRIIGDAELTLAQETAYRASAMLRRKLRNKDNLERLTIIPDYDLVETGNIIALIILHEIVDIRATASRQIIFPWPKEPKSNATLEEKEQYQEEVDNYFKRRNEKLVEKTNELVEIRRKELESLGRKKLIELHEQVAINSSCRTEMLKTYNEMATYLATYLDPDFKHRAFSSFNSFRNSSNHLKDQLIEAYTDLELSGDKLKKSHEAESQEPS